MGGMVYEVVILGAGAAGMMAAIAAGEAGGGRLKIAVLEKNVRAGIKVLVCGGGRCNFTNAGTVEFLIEQFGRNGRFLTPALRHLDNEGLRGFFAGLGVPSHEEHDGKIYPDSNMAKSVVDALVRRMGEVGVEVFAGAGSAAAFVKKQEAGIQNQEDEGGAGDRSAFDVRRSALGGVTSNVERGTPNEPPFEVITVDGRTLRARVVVLAVGGMSYQRMGTTGDGYRFAEALGHTVVTPRPAIVGLLVAEEWGKEIQGLAVRDVEVRVVVEGDVGKLATGKVTPSVNDLLFTHFGLSGPAVLNPSEVVAELLEKRPGGVKLKVDFLRHFTHAELHEVMRGWQQKAGKKRIRTMLSLGQPEVETVVRGTSPDLTWADPAMHAGPVGGVSVPARLAVKVCELEGINPEQVCAALTSGQMHRLVERLKGCVFTVVGTRGFKEAMVTAGGVKLSEVDPRTMESKVVPGLFLTGEVMDLTGPSGGYNLQLAFSTGHLAGSVVGERLRG